MKREFMKTLKLLPFLTLFLYFIGCGCSAEDPSVILINNSPSKASIQIQTSNGNTENINNVESGWESEERAFAAGDIKFTISINDSQDDSVFDLEVSECTDYIVTIGKDNKVSASSEER